MRRALTIMLAWLAATASWAQEKAIRPLDVPMSFSGTYGELRHDHFHSGVDWRVGGRTGDPIYAIKSGYISRVSVSPWGYGNGLYITHHDGTTSVYGHMLRFSDKISRIVEQEQYARESYSVNLEFGPGDFPVRQGEVVGQVGNTGSSAGPHLHMEIRDTRSEVPLNYISRGVYRPEDKTSPQFHRVCLYAVDEHPAGESWRIHNLRNPGAVRDTLALPRLSYVAIDATDRQEGTSSKLAVEEYRVLLDDTLIFSFKVGDVSFDKGRYIQSLIEYRESRNGGRDLVKTRVDPNNLLSDKIFSRDGGLIVLNDHQVHTLRIMAIDEHGNSASLRFRVRRDDGFTAPPRDSTLTTVEWPWSWFWQNSVVADGMSYYLPANSLFRDIFFSYGRVGDPEPERGICSAVWQIGSPDIPLLQPGELEIAADVPEELEGKAYMANYDKTLSYAGVRTGFGTYCVAIDTVAPAIHWLGGKNGIVSGRTIRARVSDERSGVATARVEIDGKWYLSMLKGSTVSLELKESRLRRGQHEIRLTVTDRCGNVTVETQRFTF